MMITADKRDELGRIVREAWVACMEEEVKKGIHVKPEHLVPWADLNARDKEIDRRIGEQVLAHVEVIAGKRAVITATEIVALAAELRGLKGFATDTRAFMANWLDPDSAMESKAKAPQ